jgi:hypothetical protein
MLSRLGSMICALLIAACGAPDQRSAGERRPVSRAELEASLRSLSPDIPERLATLDWLSTDHAGDPLLLAAYRQVAIEQSDGLYEEVDLGQGRTLTFVGVGDGEVLMTESGPIGTSSALAELGMGEASMAEIFATLLPGRALPQTLEREPWVEPQQVANPLTAEGVFAGTTFEDRTTRYRATGDGIASVSQAVSFEAAGGCMFRPAPISADYPATKFHACFPNWGNGFFWHHTSAVQFRFRFQHTIGNGIDFSLRKDGTHEPMIRIPVGTWRNFATSFTRHCVTRCCGLFGSCIGCSQTTCTFIRRDLRIDIFNAAGDGFDAGGFFMDSGDTRPDLQPW